MWHKATGTLIAVCLGCMVMSPMPGEAMADTELPTIQIDLDVSDPSSGVVHGQIEVPLAVIADRRQLNLGFSDIRSQPDMLQTLTAAAGDHQLTLTQPFAQYPHIWNIAWDTALTEPLIIAYTLDPTFLPPGASPDAPNAAAARLTEQLGIVRARGIIPQIDQLDLMLRVQFNLPADWSVIAPWLETEGRFQVAHHADRGVASEYIGLGHFQLSETTADDKLIRVAVQDDLPDFSLDEAVQVFQSELDLVGIPPAGGDVFTALIVSRDFMAGGSAGDHSLVIFPDVRVLAHEMFHWWNGNNIADEAMWFREGLTDYVAAKTMLALGLWSTEHIETYLTQLDHQMRGLEQSTPRSLADLSADYYTDSTALRLIYTKGPLFGWWLDQQLQAHNRSLDEALQVALTTDSDHPLTNNDLAAIFTDVYGELVAGVFEQYIFGATALPELDLSS